MGSVLPELLFPPTSIHALPGSPQTPSHTRFQPTPLRSPLSLGSPNVNANARMDGGQLESTESPQREEESAGAGKQKQAQIRNFHFFFQQQSPPNPCTLQAEDPGSGLSALLCLATPLNTQGRGLPPPSTYYRGDLSFQRAMQGIQNVPGPTRNNH